jgi:hypothetical protein
MRCGHDAGNAERIGILPEEVFLLEIPGDDRAGVERHIA